MKTYEIIEKITGARKEEITLTNALDLTDEQIEEIGGQELGWLWNTKIERYPNQNLIVYSGYVD